jgi:hypothetical protein
LEIAMQTELAEYEDADEVVELDSSTALATLTASEIDVQIQTAKRYPRSIRAFKQQAMELACLDEQTAAGMFYVLPRAGKKIEGPSVRLAEVVGSSWGNLRYGARIVATDEKWVTAQGMCFDLEKNVAASVEVRRRITKKDGTRYDDDMVNVTANAACSVALRQAIFKVVPFALVKGIYEQAKLTSIGKATSVAEKRQAMVDWFKKTGATEAQLLAFLGHKGLEDVTLEDLVTLRGLATAIKDGETTLEDALRPPDGQAGSRVRKSDLGTEPETKHEPPHPAAPDTDPEIAYLERIRAELAGCTTQTECLAIDKREHGDRTPTEWSEQVHHLAAARQAEIAAARPHRKGKPEQAGLPLEGGAT